ncbi:MAG: class I SAM-dependent methyltransferase [Flavobacteriaceae bacterium]|nr:class I SAM-dependent methyltransferase [Flavobacteriaceae bacterium]MCY4215770.1 class I SAM-dependent methyltransferase [Flavobacteriaceae bacterium]MCY4253996.1 class I SAM-dependent methyltransferase [Flavobacteriaceae bacterium]
MEHRPHKLLYQVKDHAQSQKNFDIYWNEEQTIAKTDIANIQNIEDYYSTDYIPYCSKSSTPQGHIYLIVRQWMHGKKWKLIKRHIQRKKAKILDFGAGGGYFGDYLKKRVQRVDLIESNHRAKFQCKQKGHHVYSHLKELPKSSTYDVISLWHVLEHLYNPKETLFRLKEFLDENGILVLALPNTESLDSKRYKAYWAAWDVPRHLWHFTPQGLIGLLEDVGLQVIKKRTLFFDGFYISQLSEKYKRSKGWQLKGVFWGAVSHVWGWISGNYSTMVLVVKIKQASSRD